MGCYIVIRIGHAVRDEWTNVGVAIYGDNGQKIAHRFDTLDRAIRRGDCPPGLDICLEDYAPPTLEDVRQIRDSIANYITRVQISEPRPFVRDLVRQDALDRLYALYVGSGVCTVV